MIRVGQIIRDGVRAATRIGQAPKDREDITAPKLLRKYSKARRIKAYKEIEELTPGNTPKATGHRVTMLDGERLNFMTDGSLRHTLSREDRIKLARQAKKDRKRKNAKAAGR